MMFKKAQGLDMAFRHVRSFTMVVILSVAGICCFAIYKSYEFVSRFQKKIYVLAGGTAIPALEAERGDNLFIEAKDHVRRFHELFFTLDPDNLAIQHNIDRAINLADGSARDLVKTLTENRYYAGIITANISQRIQLENDSIVVNMQSYPYYFRCNATLTLTRSSSVTIRNLKTEGFLRVVERSDNDPHGFLIERFLILENTK
jgi:conjugative transposon TraK protein